MSVVQEEDESLDDWADQVAKLVYESYRDGSDQVIQATSIESLFRGCREKRAVLAAVDKNLLFRQHFA